MGLKEKLIKAYDLQQQVAEVAKPLYEEWHNALAEAVFDVIQSKKFNGQLPTVPCTIKFSSGEEFQIKPEYMTKEGIFRNTVWKNLGADMFSLKKIVKE